MYFWPSRPAEQARNILADIPTERTRVDVVTFAPQAKKRLNLPKPIQSDPARHVTAATRIEVEADRPVEVTAVLDARTGETTLYENPIERPWLGLRTRGEAGVFFGVNEHGEQTIRLAARHEIAQIKALHVGAIGNIDITRDDTRGFVGVGAWASW